MVSARSLVCVLVLAAVGCQTTEDPFRPFYGGQLAEAEAILRRQVSQATVEDRTRLRLELASVLQAMGNYGEAAQLLSSADNNLEVLDYTSAPVDELADFAFAIESVWRPSPPERAPSMDAEPGPEDTHAKICMRTPSCGLAIPK